MEDSSWLDATQIQKAGYSVEELMERSHDFLLPQEPDVGASGWQGKGGREVDMVSEVDGGINPLDE